MQEQAETDKRNGSVRLIVLGSGDAMGSGGRLFTSFLLTTGNRHVLIDCGPSALPAFKGKGLKTSGIEAIVISHLHGDHFGGIPFFFLDYQFMTERTSPLILIGPESLPERTEEIIKANYPDIQSEMDWRFDYEYKTLASGDVYDRDGLHVEAFGMSHGSMHDALGYKIRWNGVVVGYTGDTSWNDRIPGLARGCDVMLCECYMFEERLHNHTSYVDIRAHRDEIRAERVILWHLGPDMLKNISKVDMEVAHDGMEIEIPAK